ncbi:MAG: tRNA pseudouridine(55) synthase TruB [Alphaproteobacteria bacterium]|jgi:tRNA pseudouridine55 synthase|nr:tRNA pseudouridine(55) synthase TruB [Alphaproteobacteria bacterium]MDP6590341.1 tRNA pseudouridine(55) synthase TruB [Alphaproteobacteria bacterium]MDP6816421.1 tRNA pseudouridine(55) synthase TruB [Alphaproteobacteria bacterium]|tara:strand:+ start:87 stop:983 length:897 start_codon:yes stop_codon:yes gene_type:complete
MNEPRSETPHLNGWLVIDKAAGRTSAQIVGRIKRLTGAAKVGHGGTLDPLATGVLPVALGEATKTVAYVMDGTKAYRFTLKWGEARDTDDSEGAITETSEVRPSRQQVERILPDFIGDISQMPPKYSALKVSGRRAYALARANKPVALAPRQVRIDSLRLLDSDAKTASFDVICGKGTYIRALARDLAGALGTCAHVSVLRRTAVGPFTEKAAISLDIVESLVHSARLAAHVLSVEAPLADIPALELTESDAHRLHCGQVIAVSGPDGETIRAKSGERLVALARIETGMLRPLRVFNL